MSGDVVLSVRDLTVSYRIARQRALAADRISFDLARGECFGVVGESGSGKSTLALALMQLHRPPAMIEHGSAILDGIDLLQLRGEPLRRARWSEISLIPQGAMNSLNPVLKIKHQLTDAIVAHERNWSRPRLAVRVAQLLERVGLEARVGELFPHELSGGMKQRVCIALAIVLKPKLIIADEPTSALDVVVQKRVVETLKDVQAQIGAALIMIGHDMGLMAQSVDRLAVMYAGRFVDIAPIRDFFKRPLHPYSRMLINSLPSIDERRPIRGIPGSQPSLLALPTGCAFHPRCPLAVPVCHDVAPPLETIEPRRVVACHAVAEASLARR